MAYQALYNHFHRPLTDIEEAVRSRGYWAYGLDNPLKNTAIDEIVVDPQGIKFYVDHARWAGLYKQRVLSGVLWVGGEHAPAYQLECLDPQDAKCEELSQKIHDIFSNYSIPEITQEEKS